MTYPLVYGSFPTANVRGAAAPSAEDRASDAAGFIDVGQLAHYNDRQQGVFSMNPLMSPKYAKNQGLRDAEFKDTLARLYVSFADVGPASRAAYLATFPAGGPAHALAEVLLNGNGDAGTGYVDFFLSQVNETFQEVMQVDKVLADDYVAFYYGQQPPIFQYSGMLLNSMQDDQRTGFARAYGEILRGTQLARRGAIARLRYDSVIVSGTLCAHQQTLSADNELAVPFSFSFLVKEYVQVPNTLFNRTSRADYVNTVRDAQLAKLAPVGAADDRRQRSAAVMPPAPSQVSVAGAAPLTTPIDLNQSSMLQVTNLLALNQNTPTATANVYGAVTTPALPTATPVAPVGRP